ncbi:hypothetical protein SASPL_153732 [Salvia splendens]|uniref:Uncharacterized protein n=1 Tax=Salvia splendens TaxID=180675 RepID=A0A8X8VYU7_SALSN|nr:hypothetical protein SASPL_153732 [Salvia splendens]
MSSIGASYASLHVQQKRQKERLARKMEQGGERLSVEKHVLGEASDRKAAAQICSAKGKIHPAPSLI